MILSIKLLNIEGIDGEFKSLLQSPRSHIYTVVRFVPFNAPTARDINRGMLLATVPYVGIDTADVGIYGGNVIWGSN